MITVDIFQERVEKTKIHRFESSSANIVIWTFPLGSIINYKSKPNDDLPRVTSIFKEVINVWKIYW